MAAGAERKEHPISMRLPQADIAMIDRACHRPAGRPRTDFVRRADDPRHSRPSGQSEHRTLQAAIPLSLQMIITRIMMRLPWLCVPQRNGGQT